MMENPSAKAAKDILNATKIAFTRCLFVMSDNEPNLVRSLRNIKNVSSIRAEDLNAYEILHASDMIITEKALEKMEEVFK